MKRALQAILAISIFGTLFSGVLTYGELFGEAALSCPSPGAPGTVFGYPACVYGFFMYLTITTIAAFGLRAGRARVRSSRGGSGQRHDAPLPASGSASRASPAQHQRGDSPWEATASEICCFRPHS